MKKNKILLVCALALGLPSAVSNLMHNVEPIVARAEEEAICELTFPDDNSENNKKNNYDNKWVAKKGNYEFDIINANNNYWNKWTFIRFGMKKVDSIGKINSKNVFNKSIDSILLTIDSSKNVNSIKLNVYKDSSLTNLAEEHVLSDTSAGTKKVSITNPSENY